MPFMRRVLACTLALIALYVPVRVSAWGMGVHELITRRALEGLPATLKPFFDVDPSFVVNHSVDPDLWRVVGLRGDLGDEPRNHYFHLDGLGELAPFSG